MQILMAVLLFPLVSWEVEMELAGLVYVLSDEVVVVGLQCLLQDQMLSTGSLILGSLQLAYLQVFSATVSIDNHETFAFQSIH